MRIRSTLSCGLVCRSLSVLLLLQNSGYTPKPACAVNCDVSVKIMMQPNTCQWRGRSGSLYTYEIYSINTALGAYPGNYIFARVSAQGHWEPVYIGETGDPSERFTSHHAMPCIRQENATHIHVHVNYGRRQARRAEELDLRRNFDPPCNS